MTADVPLDRALAAALACVPNPRCPTPDTCNCPASAEQHRTDIQRAEWRAEDDARRMAAAIREEVR